MKRVALLLALLLAISAPVEAARNFTAGSSQYFDATTSGTSIPLTVPFSVHVRFKPSTTTGATIWGLGNQAANNDRFTIGQVATSTIEFNARAGGTAAVATCPTTLTVGTTYSIVAVATSATSRSVTVNAGTAGTNTTSKTPGTLSHITIGKLPSTGTTYGDGDISEVAMWNVALSSAEITMLSLGVSPLLVRPLSLTNYWPMIGSGGSSSDEVDIIGGVTLTQHSTPPAAEHPYVIRPRSN